MDIMINFNRTNIIAKTIIFASYGSKNKSKTGGTRIIVDSSGNNLISESNLSFEHITSINSHRSEMYGLLSALLFIHVYCRCYILPFTSQVNYFYVSSEVAKMIKLIEDEEYYEKYINTVDNDGVYLLKQCIPCNFNIQHVWSHQDKINHRSTPKRRRKFSATIPY